MNGELPVVLGSLRYILEKAIAMSPNSSPKTGVLQSDNDADEGLNPDDSFYIHEIGRAHV